MGCFKSITRNVYKLKQLSPWELRVLLQALFLLPLVVLGLWLTGFNRTQSMLTNRLPGGDLSIDKNKLPQAYIIAKMVRVASTHGLCRATCLPQALLLRWFLRRRGIDSSLRFGANKTETQLEAHAWVEVDGVPVNDTEDVQKRYTPLTTNTKN